jgi:hypothetical protein
MDSPSAGESKLSDLGKRVYRPPTVSCYGTLRDVTLAVGSQGALDGGTGEKRHTHKGG